MVRLAVPLVVTLCAAVVPAAAQEVASVTLSHKTVQLRVGQRVGVYATANDARGVVLVGQRFEWASSDPRIVRVEADREQPDLAYLVGAGEGLAQVQVRAGSRSDAVAVQVSRADAAPSPAPAQPSGPPPAVVRIEPANVFLLPVETRPLAILFLRDDGTPAGPTAVTWRSHNPAVATVTEDGRVVGQAEGRAVIEARTANGLVATASVEVAGTAVVFAPPVLALSPGAEALAQVVVPAQGNRPLAGPAFSWRSSDPAVATVSPLGLVTATGPGRATVTAEGLGRTASLTVLVHRTVTELEWLPRRDQGPVTVPLNGSIAFEVRALDAQRQLVPDAALVWSVRDTAVAAFDTTSRRLHGRTMGRTQLQLRGPGPGLDVAWDIQVIAGGVRITPDRVGLIPGDSARLTASWTDESGRSIGPASDLTWTISNTAVGRMSSPGAFAAVGAGSARIVAATSWGKADTADLYVQGPLLITSNRGGSADVYAVDPRSPATPLRITSDPAVETMAVYSPDGASIAYVSNKEGTFDLYIANADGSAPRRVTQTPATEFTPRWTADGTRLVFGAQAPGARTAQIWTVGADGAGLTALTPGTASDLEPAVSPEGGTIAFTTTRDGNYEVYLMALDGSQPRNVSRSAAKESHPAFFPDGQLAYLQERNVGGRLVPVVVRHNLLNGEVTVVTPTDLPITDFAISAQGDLLALEVSTLSSDGRLDRRVVLIPPGGGTRVDLPRQTPAEQVSTPSFRSR